MLKVRKKSVIVQGWFSPGEICISPLPSGECREKLVSPREKGFLPGRNVKTGEKPNIPFYTGDK